MPAGVSEDSLGMFFAKHGPVGTVKIMWRECVKTEAAL